MKRIFNETVLGAKPGFSGIACLIVLIAMLAAPGTQAATAVDVVATRIVYLDGWYSFYMVGDPDEKCFGKNAVNAAGQVEMNTTMMLGKNLLAAGDLARCGNALPESLAKGWRIKQIILSQMPGEQTAAAGYAILEK